MPLHPAHGLETISGELRSQGPRVLGGVIKVPIAAKAVNHDLAHERVVEVGRKPADQSIGHAIDHGESIRCLNRHCAPPSALDRANPAGHVTSERDPRERAVNVLRRPRSH